MHVSIIAETKMVSVRGISLILEDIDLPKDLIAVHWFKDQGWEERKSKHGTVIKDITNLSPYRDLLDAYDKLFASIPEDQLPRRNSDLIDFVEDNLLNISIMRESPEWEDFRIATNRA
jgi:hypothetical protein